MPKPRSLSGREWLEELFEYEYCDECHGGADQHEVRVVMGHFFALCKDQPHTESCQLDICWLEGEENA